MTKIDPRQELVKFGARRREYLLMLEETDDADMARIDAADVPDFGAEDAPGLDAVDYFRAAVSVMQ